MRCLFLLIALLLSVPRPALAQGSWNPAGPYVTIGQDEPGYRLWYGRAQWRPTYVKAFNTYLETYGVGGVVPTWQLLRTATSWRECGAEAFEVPPTSEWPNIVATLRFIREKVVPVIGPVEAVSVYRNPALNVCAGGAETSTHKEMGAVDMVPLRVITREQLMTALCTIYSGNPDAPVGLGFYKGIRFHIDARKHREWGTAGARGGLGCVAVLAEGPLPFVETPAAAPVVALPPGPIDPLSPQQ